MVDPWAEWDAKKIGNGPWEPARPLTDEQRAAYEAKNNPCDRVLPDGWTWSKDRWLFVFRDGVVELVVRWSPSSGFFRHEFTEGCIGSGTGSTEDPGKFCEYLQWVVEIHRTYIDYANEKN